MPLIIGSQSATAAAGYTIDNSCRFNRADTPYLNWTPTAGGDDQIWTFSFWAKRGLLDAGAQVFSYSNPQSQITFEGDIDNSTWNGFGIKAGGVTWYEIKTVSKFRDTFCLDSLPHSRRYNTSCRYQQS